MLSQARWLAAAPAALLLAACSVESGMSLTAQELFGGGDLDVVARRLLDIPTFRQERNAWSIMPMPDGERLVYDRRTADRDTVEMVLANRDGGEAHVLDTGAESYPTRVSRDGEWIAYNYAATWEPYSGFELRVIRSDGSEKRSLIAMDHPEAPVDWAEALDWAPDGRSLIAHHQTKDGTSELVLHSLEEGTQNILRSFSWDPPEHAIFTRDGQHVVYSAGESGRRGQDLMLLALDGGRETRLTRDGAVKRPIGWSGDGSTLYYAVEEYRGELPVASVWSVTMIDPRRPGMPTLVRGDLVGSDLSSFDYSMGRDRIFYQVGTNQLVTAAVMTVDLEAGRVLVPPTSIGRLSARNSGIRWAGDGRHIWYARTSRSDRRGLEIVVRSMTSSEEMTIPLELDGNPAYSFWSFQIDDRTLLVTGTSRGKERSYRVDLLSGSAIPYDAHPDEVVRGTIETGAEQTRAIPFSPDGSTRYFVRPAGNEGEYDFELVAQDVRSRDIRVLIRGAISGDMRQAFRLSRDGSKILLNLRKPGGGGETVVLDTRDGRAVKVFESDGHGLGNGSVGIGISTPSLNFSSDGRFVVLSEVTGDASKGEDHRVHVWVARSDGSGRQRVYGDLPFSSHELRLSPDDRRVLFVTPEEPDQVVHDLWMLENLGGLNSRLGVR